MRSDAPVKLVENISVENFFLEAKEALKLKIVGGEKGLNALIRDKTLNRPALALTGYWKHFGHRRIQLFGAGEMGYLRDLNEDAQYNVLEKMFQKHIPCILISRNLAPTKPMLKLACEKNLPLIRSSLTTRDVATIATLVLEEKFAPSTMEHGTMVDIKGIGTLIRGDSGVGKSECALSLVARGHSLITDDVVPIKLLNETELIAISPELNRGYMECRGMGIINITDLFGIGATRLKQRIELVITFVDWTPEIEEDRIGLEDNFYEILGRSVPHSVIVVRPGRDLAQLVEIASMVEALKQNGHHPALEFNERLITRMSQ